jgi:2'-5' RNA ligase
MAAEREQDEAYRRIWQGFRATPTVADGRHDTADWRSRRGPFAIALVRIPPLAMQPALDRLRADLAPFPFVRLHPDGFHHVTLQELGFLVDVPSGPDEINRVRLEEFTQAAAAAVAERAPFAISLGGVNSFQDAAYVEVRDGGNLEPLHARLLELAAIPRAPQFAYVPHVTVAHYTADAPNHHLAAVLSRWRRTSFGATTVSAIEIATLRVDEPYPPLEPWAVLPLGG